MSETPRFSEWAVLELMGHRKLAGLVTEQTVAGVGFLRLDVPDGPTQFYSPQSVYCMTPVSEPTAREFAKAHVPAPVTRWELPGLPSGGGPTLSPEILERPDDPDELPF